MSLPALAAPRGVPSAASEKFGSTVRLNYTAMPRMAATRGTWHGGNWNGGHWHGRYPYYGYRYPYWGGGYWYGYPYAALAFGIPLAYAAGYYSAAPYYYPYGYGYGYPQGYYNGQIVTETAPGYRSSSHSEGGSVSRSVQAALQQQGYYQGAVDGLFGPQSQQAMAQFQQAHGLKVTGLIDSSSLHALGLR
jgi:hypothetical protein